MCDLNIWAYNIRAYNMSFKLKYLMFSSQSCILQHFAKFFQVGQTAGLVDSIVTNMDQTRQYTRQNWTKIIEVYFAAEFVLLTQRHYRRDFARNKVPDIRTIEHLMAKFWETGSLGNANTGHSSRSLSAKTPKNIQNLRIGLKSSQEIQNAVSHKKLY